MQGRAKGVLGNGGGSGYNLLINFKATLTYKNNVNKIRLGTAEAQPSKAMQKYMHNIECATSNAQVVHIILSITSAQGVKESRDSNCLFWLSCNKGMVVSYVSTVNWGGNTVAKIKNLIQIHHLDPTLLHNLIVFTN